VKRRQKYGGLVDIEIISIKISGNPSAVHAATLKLIFENGNVSEEIFKFEPDGIMFENFEETVSRLHLQLNRKTWE
jgi:hypothetical protein